MLEIYSQRLQIYKMPQELVGLLGTLTVFDSKTSDFSVFKERLNQFFIANKITDEVRQKAILLNTLSEDCYILVRSLCVPELPDSKSYNTLIKILTDHFSPIKSYFAERLKFYNSKRKCEESVADWEARIKKLASNCGFKTELDTVMRDIFVIGMNNEKIMDRLFEEDASKVEFKEIVKLALNKESALNERSARESLGVPIKTEPVNHHRQGNSYSEKQHGKPSKGHLVNSAAIPSRSGYKVRNQQSVSIGSYNNSHQKPSKCTCCGRTNHRFSQCVYKSCTCHKCGIKGHLAPQCGKSKPHNFLSDLEGPDDSNFNVEENTNSNYEESIFSIHEFKTQGNVKPTYVKLMAEGIPISFEADSGFAHSAISKKMYLKHFNNLELCTNDLALRDYVGITFEPIGYLNLNINFENKSYILKTYVIKNGGPPLIGRNGLKMLSLGIRKLEPAICSNLCVTVADSSTKVTYLMNKYSDIFEDKLGTFNKFQVSLKLKEGAIPKFFKPRPVPFALKPKIERELERLVNNKVLIPTEFSDWATPIVPVLKPNGSVRICGDFKITLNPQLQSQYFPLPRIEYLFSQLQGGSKFSKIDLSDAYQQLILTEESRKLVTITTHKGLFSYTRLPYGITCAGALFQNIMEQMFLMPGVVCFLDDILVTGKTDQEHLERLEHVFKKLKECGLKVKKEKCCLFQNSVKYLGHVIDKEGLHTSDERVFAIKRVPVPGTVTELKSFLGMINFYCKFIPNASAILKPLYSLLKKDTKWEWTPECNTSFQKAKEMLLSSSVLAHFDPKKKIKLTVDASQFALGATLSHIFDDGTERPIAFASRLLNKAEISYSQIEKEAAAIIFGVKKFFQYIFNQKFLLYTDHKPLLSIFGDHKGIPVFAANRLQRWAHILSAFDYEIKFVSSEKNTADCLSRLPTILSQETENDRIAGLKLDANISYLHYVQDSKFPISQREIKRETATDKILSKIIVYVRSGWPDVCPSNEFKPFFLRRNELTIEQGCLMWGYRIVVPKKYQDYVLSELHSSHMGVVRMKSLARSYVWWPNLDEQIEGLSKGCKACAVYSSNPPKSSLAVWDWPKVPWTRLHADFFGPLFNKNFLVVQDATSKWIECFEVNDSTAATTIKIFRELFSRFGLPLEICTDNAKTFTSEEFQAFLLSSGIKHLTGAPYHPATNGLAESAVKIIKNAILKARHENPKCDIHLIVHQFLFQFRNTPHTTTGERPSQLLLGHSLRTRFDLLLPSVESVVERKQAYKKTYYSRNKNVYFAEGDRVWARDFRSNSARWCTGTISKVLGRRTYLVKTDGGMNWRRHVDQLKPSHMAASSSDDKYAVSSVPRSEFNNDQTVIGDPGESVDDSVVDNTRTTAVSPKNLRPRDQIKAPERLNI